MTSLTLNLPEKKARIALAEKEVFVIANGDLRDSANTACWEVQQSFEQKLETALKEKFGYLSRRAHPVKEAKGHGFIGSQREGSDVLSSIDPEAPVIVLMTPIILHPPWYTTKALFCCWLTLMVPGPDWWVRCAWRAL